MALLFDLIVTREQGKVIPAWRHAFPVRLLGVSVIVEHVFEKQLARYISRARVLNPPNDKPCPSPIWDARLIDLTPDRLVVGGFERVEDGIGVERDYAQSWVLLPAKG